MGKAKTFRYIIKGDGHYHPGGDCQCLKPTRLRRYKHHWQCVCGRLAVYKGRIDPSLWRPTASPR